MAILFEKSKVLHISVICFYFVLNVFSIRKCSLKFRHCICLLLPQNIPWIRDQYTVISAAVVIRRVRRPNLQTWFSGIQSILKNILFRNKRETVPCYEATHGYCSASTCLLNSSENITRATWRKGSRHVKIMLQRHEDDFEVRAMIKTWG